MLYDSRNDYIRRREPKKVPSPELRVLVGLTVLMVSAALLFAAISPRKPAEINESFQQLFSWG